MAIYKKVTLTNQGTTLMNDLISSSRSLSFTRMATTEESYSDRNIEGLTVIPNEVQTEAIYQQERIGDTTIRVEVLISNEELNTSYAINSIGVYANDLEGKEILFGIASAERAFQMPSSTSGMPTGAIFRLHIGIGQTELATLERAPFGMANISDIINLQDKIKLLEENSTSRDAELIDIRIGANGTVYETAGEAVRNVLAAYMTAEDEEWGI